MFIMKMKCRKIFIFLSLFLIISCSGDDEAIVKSPQVPKPVVGQQYKGGIVAYILKPTDNGFVEGEDHGLIITESDISTNIKWGPNYDLVHSDKFNIGDGLPNTHLIVAKFGQDENALNYVMILT